MFKLVILLFFISSFLGNVGQHATSVGDHDPPPAVFMLDYSRGGMGSVLRGSCASADLLVSGRRNASAGYTVHEWDRFLLLRATVGRLARLLSFQWPLHE